MHYLFFVNNYLCMLGAMLKVGFEKMGLETFGMLPLTGFKLKNDIEQTIFNREMLKRGILATNNVYLSYAHKPKHIELYLKEVARILKKMPKLTRNKFLRY